MSRLGAWEPQGIEERLDRMESLAAIQQLPVRYALALDSRDIGALVDLFVPHVRVGRDRAGRAALEEWFTETMRAMRTSVHLVANHIVDFDDADHAHGIVYCHDELEWPERGEWEQGKLQYWDTYERVEGEWCFARRRFHRWYIVDALTRPSSGAGVNQGTDALATGLLPDAFPTWAPFWAASRRPSR
jgi:SnoaL-like domain